MRRLRLLVKAPQQFRDFSVNAAAIEIREILVPPRDKKPREIIGEIKKEPPKGGSEGVSQGGVKQSGQEPLASKCWTFR